VDELYPLLFTPILKPKVWGGRSLERLGKVLPAGASIGESWEIADLPASIPDGRSIIANGALAGRTLAEVRRNHPEALLGACASPASASGFPLLVKYLDAREHLSVQVHPTPAYVAAHPETHLKSEAWYVVDAAPGAVIYRGVNPNVDAKTFATHVRDGTVVDDLIAVEVSAGDCHYLPSGTCHALGAGVLVAEVQTPSDTTFRVFDWGRTGRALHVEEALSCIDFGSPPAPTTPPAPPSWIDGRCHEPLVLTEFFGMTRVTSAEGYRMPIDLEDRPRVLMVVSGEGAIHGSNGESTRLTCGTTVLLPAALGSMTVRMEASSCLLDVTIPASDDRAPS